VSDISEKVEIFQNMLIADATSGGGSSVAEYRELRDEIINHHLLKDIIPRFVRTCRSPAEFWQFIKYKFATYAERRQFIWEEFRPMLERLDGNAAAPSDQSVSLILQRFNAETVHQLWSKALERRESDPEGAVTLARTLLESVCKHILDEHTQSYRNDADLPALYRQTAELLNIAPSQHSEQIFRQILGGCTAVVEGLGALRNKLSDAHGQGSRAVRPAARHAELAVNLAGAVAIFLIATNEAKREKQAR
jgi:Abortive infection C-terminus